MDSPLFFNDPKPATLSELIDLTGASPRSDFFDQTVTISGVGPLMEAGEGELSFLDNPKYTAFASETKASAVFCSKRYADLFPDHVAVLVSGDPYRSFAQALGKLYPEALKPQPMTGESGHSERAFIHQNAVLEEGVIVEAGASIGPGANLGAGTLVGPNAIIGPNVQIGRNCCIGAGVSVQHSLLGNNVTLHPGVCCGQDGFGFAMGPGGHLKVPQIGRVIIQDQVEIGANSTIDRGANRDTIIGEGSKIDNQVQIGHNVVIGRHCVIVSHVGISGSVTLEDFVVLGGKVGVAGHLTIGMGTQIAASSNVNKDIPAGSRWGGTPAKPIKDWFREMTTLKNLASRDGGSKK